MEENFLISEPAKLQIRYLNEKEGRHRVFRIQIKGGGCSGFQYVFTFESASKPDDLLFGDAGAQVAIDPISFGFLKGAQLNFVEDLIGSSFSIKNPNANSGCGCGSSFSV